MKNDISPSQAEKEKSVPAERISQDARCEATTPTVTPSTDVWICGLDGRVTIHPTIPAPAEAVQVKAENQPEDVLAILPKRSTHWLKTMQHGEARWKRNGRSAQ